MKYILISFLSALLLFSCPQNGSAQGNTSTKPPVRKFKHNSKVETIYDKAKDQTTTYLRPMTLRYVKSSIEARMISEGKTDFLPAEVLSMTAYFISAGKGLTKPQFVVIGFRSMALDQTKYADNRALAVILDSRIIQFWTNHVQNRQGGKTVSTPISIGPSLSRIGQICVNVHDLDRAIVFYRDTLGIKFLFRAPPNMAFFDCDGIRLMLGIPDRPDLDHPASIIYYKVDDIERVYETFKARGVDFVIKPHLVAPMPTSDLWLADFRDSEGNLLALMSEVPRAVA